MLLLFFIKKKRCSLLAGSNEPSGVRKIFQWGWGSRSVTPHCDDVKILRNITSSRWDVTGSVSLDF